MLGYSQVVSKISDFILQFILWMSKPNHLGVSLLTFSGDVIVVIIIIFL